MAFRVVNKESMSFLSMDAEASAGSEGGDLVWGSPMY